MYQSSGRTHTPSEGKHQRPRSLLLEHLIALLVQSGYLGLSLSLCPACVSNRKDVSAILSQYWLALCAGK